MAVKKAAAPKKSSAPKTAAPKKAAPKKAAPKKATTKKSTSKKTTMPAQATAKPAGAKKVVAKKAPAIKLSDSQTRVLGSVQSASEAGYAGGKGEGKILESLLKKKLVKRGKKVDGSARYLTTKAGQKFNTAAPAPAAVISPPSPAAEATASPAPAATA
jgi:hypothetical protein